MMYSKEFMQKMFFKVSNKWHYNQIFVFCIVIFYIISLFIFVLSRGTFWTRLFWESNVHPFSDFYMPIKEASTLNPYIDSNISPYPPMAFFIFYIISLLVERNIIYIVPWNEFHQYQSFVLLYFILLLGIILCIIYICIIQLEKHRGLLHINHLMAVLFMLISYPFLYSYERGNIVILAMMLSLIFVLYHDSEENIEKYIAFISLAIAASIKVYPALFGILLFRKQRIKDIFLLIALGVACFVIPFAFFNGGLGNVFYFFSKLFNFESNNNHYWIGVGSMLATLEHFLKSRFGIIIHLSHFSTILSILVILPLVFFTISFKSLIYKVFSICVAMCLFLTNAPYITLYFAIPLILVFVYNDNKSIFLRFILIAIFAPYPLLLLSFFSQSEAGVIKAIYYDLILVISYIHISVEFSSTKRITVEPV